MSLWLRQFEVTLMPYVHGKTLLYNESWESGNIVPSLSPNAVGLILSELHYSEIKMHSQGWVYTWHQIPIRTAKQVMQTPDFVEFHIRYRN